MKIWARQTKCQCTKSLILRGPVKPFDLLSHISVCNHLHVSSFFFFCISLFFSSIWLLPFSPFMSGFASFLPRFSSLSFCLSYFAKYHNLSFLFPMRPKFACCINTKLIRLLTMRERGISVVCGLWYLILINGFKFDIIIVQARIQWKKKCLLIHVSRLVNMSSIFALFYYSLLFLKI